MHLPVVRDEYLHLFVDGGGQYTMSISDIKSTYYLIGENVHLS